VNARVSWVSLLLVVTTAAGCSSSGSGDGAGAAATTTSLATSTTSTEPMSSTTVTASTTAPPTTAPRPRTTPAPAPAPTGPRLSGVAVSGYPGGITCTPGDLLNITLTFTTQHAAGVLIWSSNDGNIGQFPAEFGQAEVPYHCTGSPTLFTLYPVAEGGEIGDSIDLSV
jgi:hypothetical protein